MDNFAQAKRMDDSVRMGWLRASEAVFKLKPAGNTLQV